MIVPDSLLIALPVVIVALHGLGVILALHAILHSRSPQGTIAWVLTLSFMPYIGILAYLVFGWPRFEGYTNARRAGNSAINQLGAELAARPELADCSWAPDDPELAAFSSLAQLPYLRGNATSLLIDGGATFDAILAGIAAAEREVLVQFFIIRDDAIGRRLRDACIERAEAGCRVLLLYDEIGSIGLPRAYIRSLRAAGVAVCRFGTQRGLRHRFRINFRNHRKIVVVDGARAWVGGHNVGDEYLGRNPRFGHWRDTHLQVEGPAALALQLVFLEDWYWAAGTVPELSWTVHPAPDDTPLLVVPSGPADDVDTATLLVVQAISMARERLWIVSPYFVPDTAVVAALQLAALRGVDVRIMLPRKPDQWIVWLVAHTFLAELEPCGVRLFAYDDGFLHQKVMLVDERLCSIGTCNLDNRSLRINFEVTAIGVDPALVAQVEAMLQADFARCRPFTLAAYQERSWFFRLLCRAGRLLAPLL